MRIRFTSLLLCLLLALPGWPSQQRVNELYAQFSKFPLEQLMDMGQQYYARHQGEEALACYSVVISRFHDSATGRNDNRIASALNNRGCIYKYIYYDYTRAYEDMSRSLQMCEQNNDARLMPIVCANLGTLLNDYSRQYGSDVVGQQAQLMFQRGFEGALHNKDWELLATSFANLAEFHHDIDLAKFKPLLSAEIPDTVPNMRYARLLYRGIEHLQHGNSLAARQCFEQQKEVIDWHDTPERLQIIAMMNVADTYLTEGNHELAVSELLAAEQIAMSHDARDLEFQLCQQLSECYHHLHQPELARKYHIAYLEKKDSLMRANQLVSVGEQNFITELRLEEEKVRSLTAKQQVQTVVIALAVLILLILMAFVLVVHNKNKQLTSRNQALYQRMQQMMAAQEPIAPANGDHEKYSGSSLQDDEKEQLLSRIQQAMNNAELICTQGFTITQLAQHVGSNSTYVSQVINEKYGYTFNVLLGNSRVIEACRRMRDNGYEQLTLEAISQSVGFKSRGTFITAFKRVVGMTPSEYLKVARTQGEQKSHQESEAE